MLHGSVRFGSVRFCSSKEQKHASIDAFVGWAHPTWLTSVMAGYQ